MLQFIFSGLDIHVMLWQHCAYDLVMFRHSVRVRKRPCFGFKISVLFPQTWLEMYRRPVKNISIYCRHKHDWKMSLELLKHIQQCHACRCWDAIVPLFRFALMTTWYDTFYRNVHPFHSLWHTHMWIYVYIYGLQKYLIAKGGEFIDKWRAYQTTHTPKFVTTLPNGGLVSDSHPWIFLGTPGDVFTQFHGIGSGCLSEGNLDIFPSFTFNLSVDLQKCT